jgi:PEP-CTERM motif-containing protein
MRKLVLFVGLFLVPSAYAGSVPAAFVSWSGGAWQNGYPYSVIIAGEPTAVMCDDYVHGGAPGTTWEANITNLGTGNLSLTRFNTLANALTLYEEAGWILLKTSSIPSNQWSSMTYVVWHIFDPAVPLDNQLEKYWFKYAQAVAASGFPGVNFNQVDILTPVDQYGPDPNSIQEFLYLTSNANGTAIPIPEPNMLLLLGTGLVGLLRLIGRN